MHLVKTLSLQVFVQVQYSLANTNLEYIYIESIITVVQLYYYTHFLSTPKGKWLEEVIPTVPPRLFQCSNASGRFNVEEIFDFSQEVGIYVVHH